GGVGDQGHLAEEVVGAHEGDRDRVAGRLLDIDLAAARLDDEHRVAGVALVDDDRAAGGGSGGQAAGQGMEDVVREGEEDRHPLEDLETPPKFIRRAGGWAVVVAHAGGNYRFGVSTVLPIQREGDSDWVGSRPLVDLAAAGPVV